MPRILLILLLLILAAASFSLSGISLSMLNGASLPEMLFQNLPASPTPEITATLVPTSIPPTHTPEPTLTPTNTATAIPTETPTAVPPTEESAAWQWFDAEEIPSLPIPILLYHHVSSEAKYRSYTVQPEDFQSQMNALKERGYQTISVSLLAQAIQGGASLPERPIVITFDDGNASVYEKAYPVMNELGFTGTLYLVSSYLDKGSSMTTSQVLEMIESGWEIGSHSVTHADLTKVDTAGWEISTSKRILQEHLLVDVNSFAYPFGVTSESLRNQVFQMGYLAAAGLGKSYLHSRKSLYYLSRIEIKNGVNLELFNSLLPW